MKPPNSSEPSAYSYLTTLGARKKCLLSTDATTHFSAAPEYIKKALWVLITAITQETKGPVRSKYDQLEMPGV
jgi:hypothetical protein